MTQSTFRFHLFMLWVVCSLHNLQVTVSSVSIQAANAVFPTIIPRTNTRGSNVVCFHSKCSFDLPSLGVCVCVLVSHPSQFDALKDQSVWQVINLAERNQSTIKGQGKVRLMRWIIRRTRTPQSSFITNTQLVVLVVFRPRGCPRLNVREVAFWPVKGSRLHSRRE